MGTQGLKTPWWTVMKTGVCVKSPLQCIHQQSYYVLVYGVPFGSFWGIFLSDSLELGKVMTPSI